MLTYKGGNGALGRETRKTGGKQTWKSKMYLETTCSVKCWEGKLRAGVVGDEAGGTGEV